MDDSYKLFVNTMLSVLDERSRRIFLGGFSTLPECRSIAELNAYTKVSRNTIAKGRDEYNLLAGNDSISSALPEPSRIRESGGGRKSSTELNPELWDAVTNVLDGHHKDKSKNILFRTVRSLRILQKRLSNNNINISHVAISRLLNAHGCISRRLDLLAKASEDELSGYSKQYQFIENVMRSFFDYYLPVLYIRLNGTITNSNIPCGLENTLSGIIMPWWNEVKDTSFENSRAIYIIFDYSEPFAIAGRSWDVLKSSISKKCSLRPFISILPPGRSIIACNDKLISDISFSEKAGTQLDITVKRLIPVCSRDIPKWDKLVKRNDLPEILSSDVWDSKWNSHQKIRRN